MIVVDDAQWADEATLDVLRLLAGRLAGVRAAVVVIYRDDELDRWHPLRILIGEIGVGHAIDRVCLQPFSLEAVTSLAARHGASPAELFRTTRGNPFFVTEVLTAHNPGVPPTVRDAVLARAARLSPAARELLDVVAIAPSHTELWLLDSPGTPGPYSTRLFAADAHALKLLADWYLTITEVNVLPAKPKHFSPSSAKQERPDASPVLVPPAQAVHFACASCQRGGVEFEPGRPRPTAP